MKVLKHGQQNDVMGSLLRTETEATIIIIVCVISQGDSQNTIAFTQDPSNVEFFLFQFLEANLLAH